MPGGASGLRTDIDVQAPRITGTGPETVPRVIIEVKGSWNRELQSSMRTQLVEKYLDRHGVTSGLYLVGYFTCNSWKRGQRYNQSLQCGTKGVLESSLNTQAADLANPLREVRALVMDLSLPERTDHGSARGHGPRRKRAATGRQSSTRKRQRQAKHTRTRKRTKRDTGREGKSRSTKTRNAPRRGRGFGTLP